MMTEIGSSTYRLTISIAVSMLSNATFLHPTETVHPRSNGWILISQFLRISIFLRCSLCSLLSSSRELLVGCGPNSISFILIGFKVCVNIALIFHKNTTHHLTGAIFNDIVGRLQAVLQVHALHLALDNQRDHNVTNGVLDFIPVFVQDGTV